MLANATLIFLMLISLAVHCAEPPNRYIPFQGHLVDRDGKAIDGVRMVRFQIFGEPTGGIPIWTGEDYRASVNGGLVNVILGTKNPFPFDQADQPKGQPGKSFFDQPLYLQITVGANANSITDTDSPLAPRQTILPVVFARESALSRDSVRLGGVAANELLDAGGKLRGDRIAPGTIQATSLDPGSVLSMSSSLVQSASIPGLTALEAIKDHDALSFVRDTLGLSRLVPASAASTERAKFFGFALNSAAPGSEVRAHQYGPLGGFSNLFNGRSYYIAQSNGAITDVYPSGIQSYVGHALSETMLFVDPFGFSKTWASSGNYWGNGSDGALNTGAAGSVSFPVAVDGEVVVKQYSSLTINAGDIVTTANRCRGLVIYVDGDATINGTLTMTARGANVDPTLPDSIFGSGIRLVRRKTGGTETLVNSELGGAGAGGVGAMWRGVEAAQPGVQGNGAIYTIAREGGAGGLGRVENFSPGGTLLNGTGGGGSGSGYGGGAPGPGGKGGQGTCYSGGSGGGGSLCIYSGGAPGTPGGAFGGRGGDGQCVAGGGAGNPGANEGTGGLLILLTRGALTIGPQGKVTADGVMGGTSVGPGGLVIGHGGGASGGGRIVLLYGADFRNQGNVKAAGGLSPVPGGDGAVTVDKIDP